MPAQPAIMILGGAATLLQMAANALAAVPVVGLVLGAPAQMVGWRAFVCLQYTIRVIEGTAAVPFGSFVVEGTDIAFAIVFYAALAVVTGGVRRALGLMFAQIWIPIALLAAITVFVWMSAFAWSDGRTRVMSVAGAQGDATLMRTGQDEQQKRVRQARSNRAKPRVNPLRNGGRVCGSVGT